MPAGRPRRNAARLPRRRWRRIAVLLMTPVVDRWSETTTLLLLRRPSKQQLQVLPDVRGVACYEYEYRRFAACVRCAPSRLVVVEITTPSNAKHAIKQARHNAPAVVRGISWRLAAFSLPGEFVELASPTPAQAAAARNHSAVPRGAGHNQASRGQLQRQLPELSKPGC